MRRRQAPAPPAPDRARVRALVEAYIDAPRSDGGREALAELRQIAGGGGVGEMVGYYVGRNAHRGVDHLTDVVMGRR